MSNHIKVSVPRMKSDGELLQADAEKIPQFIRELDAAMKKLGTCWEGPAWVTFQNQVESDILYMLDVYDWLKEFMQAMSEAEKIYGNSEKKSYDCVDAIRV